MFVEELIHLKSLRITN